MTSIITTWFLFLQNFEIKKHNKYYTFFTVIWRTVCTLLDRLLLGQRTSRGTRVFWWWRVFVCHYTSRKMERHDWVLIYWPWRRVHVLPCWVMRHWSRYTWFHRTIWKVTRWLLSERVIKVILYLTSIFNMTLIFFYIAGDTILQFLKENDLYTKI